MDVVSSVNGAIALVSKLRDIAKDVQPVVPALPYLL